MNRLSFFMLVKCSFLTGLMVGLIAFGEPSFLAYVAIVVGSLAILIAYMAIDFQGDKV